MKKTVSKIVTLEGPGKVAIREEELCEESLGENDVLGETLYSALSVGTELAAYAGAPPLRPGPVYPRVVGYCNVAEIKAVGAMVKSFRPGDRVLNFQSHRSSFICDQAAIASKLPENADSVCATTTYLFHLAYSALLKGGFVPGHRVSFVGLGTIGIAGCALASSFGAIVEAFSNQEASRSLALRIGARAAHAKTETDGQAGSEEFGRADLVITTSNDWSDWRLALEVAREGGTICMLGFPGRTDPIPDFNPLDSRYFYDKQLTIVACGKTPDFDVPRKDLRFTLKRNCAYLLERIADGKLPARELISGIRPWEEIEEVYKELMNRSDKAVLSFVLKWR